MKALTKKQKQALAGVLRWMDLQNEYASGDLLRLTFDVEVDKLCSIGRADYEKTLRLMTADNKKLRRKVCDARAQEDLEQSHPRRKRG